METVTVSELNQQTAKVLERIKAGETLEISEYGKPVARLALLSMDDAAPTAEITGDPMLRNLDSIHLATAYGVRTSLTAFICYDKRLCVSAQALGLPVESPA